MADYTEEEIEKMTLAANLELKRQWNGQPIPFSVDDPYVWTVADGGEIDLSALMCAALSAVPRVPEGYWLAPDEPTPEMIEAGRMEMPVEVRYWQEGNMLHAEPIPISKCVSPATVYRAMRDAAKEKDNG